MHHFIGSLYHQKSLYSQQMMKSCRTMFHVPLLRPIVRLSWISSFRRLVCHFWYDVYML
jgi:hypothetical protein